MTTPPLIFPTDVLLIDDDLLYAQLFAKNFQKRHGIDIRLVADADELLRQSKNDFIFLHEDKITNHPSKRSDLPKNIQAIQKQLENTASVVIADFHMEKINGLDLLTQIQSNFVYKILISNFIDYEYSKEINEALNSGSIDAALDKKHNLPEQLKQSISKGRNRFFSLLSSDIIYSFMHSNRLSDPDLSSFIWEMIEKIKPKYMRSNNNLDHFQFTDNEKFEKTLFITTPEDVTALLECYQAEVAPASVLDKLKSHTFMLTCENPFSVDGVRWADFLMPANKIKGRFNEYIVSLKENTCLSQVHISK